MDSAMSWTVVNRDENSSLYGTVESILVERESWEMLPSSSTRFNLMLGDRNRLPFSKLGLFPGLLQSVNYYRGSNCLCRKASMERTLRAHVECKEGADAEMPLWLPKTFIVKAQDADGDERSDLVSYAAEHPSVLWIAKLSSGAKGEGIHIGRTAEEMVEFVDAQSLTYCVQEYVANPLLLPGGRKFDIRCWVLLDSHYNVYVYKEGVLRTCSEEYDGADLDNVISHLSNHCIQEAHSDDFGKYEEGNEMFFSDFDDFLRTKGKNIEDDILPQVYEIVSMCFDAAEPRLRVDPEYLKYFPFQLFGFDFLVDAEYKVWLLEINGAPAAAESVDMDVCACVKVLLLLVHFLVCVCADDCVKRLRETFAVLLSTTSSVGATTALHQQTNTTPQTLYAYETEQTHINKKT
eukprot:m.122185 g.122185  ORF g.122185 m.122185 type:complete len:406 (+) comp12934_c0_seq10:46-1263(+)